MCCFLLLDYIVLSVPLSVIVRNTLLLELSLETRNEQNLNYCDRDAEKLVASNRYLNTDQCMHVWSLIRIYCWARETTDYIIDLVPTQLLWHRFNITISLYCFLIRSWVNNMENLTLSVTIVQSWIYTACG